MTTEIEIRGASQHNLQSVDLDLPRDRLVVFCGPSGSGKSSLAFDTLYAEGQRRYVESLSSYARQFLGQMDKPRYESIRGLTPTIAVAQGAGSRNPRSTVGTLTEVLDYLRVLFARAGQQRCHGCGQAVSSQSAGEIVRQLSALPQGERLLVLAPVLTQRKGVHAGLVRSLREQGFARLRVDGQVQRIEEVQLHEHRRQDVEVVVDRLRVEPSDPARLAEAVESALSVGEGVLILARDGLPDTTLSEHLACHACGLSFPELSPQSFSFNSPRGMCPDCGGLGFRAEIDPARVVPDPSLSVHQGAIEPFARTMAGRDSMTYKMVVGISEILGFSLDTPWKELSGRTRSVLLYGTDERFSLAWDSERFSGTVDMEWEGVVRTLARRMSQTKSERQRQSYMAYLHDTACPTCQGQRLRPESLAVVVGELHLADLVAVPVRQAREQLESIQLSGARAEVARELLRECVDRLRFLEEVGLGYLSLDRSAATLSGGEAQRIRLAGQLGGELTGVTYVLDEPSMGLHPRDTRALVGVLQRLRDQGNTVLVVEHDRDTIEAADHVVDFGPGAGAAGGRVVFSGDLEGLRACSSSITGDYLAGRRHMPVPEQRRAGSGRHLRVVGARQNNLQDLTVDIPLGTLCVVTGVSGAGKSSLVRDLLSPALHNALHRAQREVGAVDRIEGIEHLHKVIDIDQSPIGRSPRSNPATYTKVFDLIRGVFAGTKDAKVLGFGAGRFSFNSRGGRCEACRGDGVRKVEMHFLPDVYVPCEVCGGSRFDASTLAVRFKGHSIADVLALTVAEALDLFAHHRKIARILGTLDQVGLGYLPLGQPSNTLSGGEAQRIKLSRELGRPADEHTLYLLDEPTTGLHFEDVRKLLAVLHRLVDQGHSVLVVEHDLDVVRAADHVIDLGPEGGEGGGRVVAEGTPEEIMACEASWTGRCLRGCSQ